jgi:hypothetical protein
MQFSFYAKACGRVNDCLAPAPALTSFAGTNIVRGVTLVPFGERIFPISLSAASLI